MVDISNGVNMHELTKQLAEQAELLQFVNGMTCYRQQHKLEKFAELIVAECVRTIQMGITRDGHDTEKYLRSIKHIKQIKEHFGVEPCTN